MRCDVLAVWYLSVTDSSYVPFWLPAALYLAVLLMYPPAQWHRYLLMALMANAAFDLPSGTPLPAMLGFYTANTIQSLIGAWLLRRLASSQMLVLQLREFLWLVAIGAGLAPFLAAFIGAATVTVSGMGTSFAGAWEVWFANSAM
ncbi:MAG: MASE1 domain-containing protein, partial [Planctomycetaceae bacterium]|nr:MASE1 domain-containing protein [Planctomycetaceae bacterium]